MISNEKSSTYKLCFHPTIFENVNESEFHHRFVTPTRGENGPTITTDSDRLSLSVRVTSQR
jgi:hypothetical protein